MTEVVFDGRMVADPEVEYLRLRLTNEPGWGGPNHARRQAGWIDSIAHLRELPDFPQPPARLLELGCGNGMVSALFAAQGYRIDGIDLSATAISWAREIFEKTGMEGQFRQGTVGAMPFHKNETFDLVVDGNCFHCLLGETRSKCLAEIHRVLRPDGVFVVSTMCGEPKIEALREHYDAQMRQLVDQGRPYRTLKPVDEILDEMRAAKFEISHHVLGEGVYWDHLVLVCRPELCSA
ncbi:class I SAM-dependent methyltransferase [Microvirga puerhi]|uniref:Class I SAM-dependent methyltransferase n=1 Tax=Microvirga puerhi TaxID=2876078 RepID=A0ABS7VHY6_9HYPH|nr:class I SAM-dependent methyltransferase [Microvirga puerhi]MBZ6075119.1 class I SAM-dependent methyltransferase [Microvirga puerhi]